VAAYGSGLLLNDSMCPLSHREARRGVEEADLASANYCDAVEIGFTPPSMRSTFGGPPAAAYTSWIMLTGLAVNHAASPNALSGVSSWW
jgi:hypothetical protein